MDLTGTRRMPYSNLHDHHWRVPNASRIGTNVRFDAAFPTRAPQLNMSGLHALTTKPQLWVLFLMQYGLLLFVCMHAHVSFLISLSYRLWGSELVNSVYTPADQCRPCRITDTSGTSPLPLSSRLVSAPGSNTAAAWCEISSALREAERAIALSPICASLSALSRVLWEM